MGRLPWLVQFLHGPSWSRILSRILRTSQSIRFHEGCRLFPWGLFHAIHHFVPRGRAFGIGSRAHAFVTWCPLPAVVRGFSSTLVAEDADPFFPHNINVGLPGSSGGACQHLAPNSLQFFGPRRSSGGSPVREFQPEFHRLGPSHNTVPPKEAIDTQRILTSCEFTTVPWIDQESSGTLFYRHLPRKDNGLRATALTRRRYRPASGRSFVYISPCLLT